MHQSLDILFGFDYFAEIWSHSTPGFISIYISDQRDLSAEMQHVKEILFFQD